MHKLTYSAVAAGLATLAAISPTHAASGGMPQLDFGDYAPQLVWLAITFAVLYFIMSRMAVPAISDTLERRQAMIQADLDAAEKANEDTRTLVALYEKRLAEAREESRRLQRERAEADSAHATAQLAALGERLGGRIGEAEKRIADQRAQVLSGLEQMAGEIAQSVYHKLAGQPADAAALDVKVAAAVKGGSR
ncbi:MAG: F0F1 ATP synthase subunit B' [Enhydrobacter sp.]|nr:MAG: F0F1 ATP synthase subunit B' [Enhydrobacter sp.]